MLALGIRYLTGYAVATNVSSRERAEWPPHPARIFMAMAAAMFETGEDAEERIALEWLESLGPPKMRVSEADECRAVEFYVPVNDSHPEDLLKNKILAAISEHSAPIDAEQAAEWKREIDRKAKTAIVAPTACRLELAKRLSENIECTAESVEVRSQVLAQIRDTEWKKFASAALDTLPRYRSRQSRHFPRVRPTDDTVFLLWSNADPDGKQRVALERLCTKVTRVGHSSSLVQMWVEQVPPECNLEPADFGEHRLRMVSTGSLAYLESMANIKVVERHAELKTSITSAEAEKKAVKAKGSKERKADIQADIDALESELAELDPRPPLRPTISLWQTYRQVDAQPQTSSIASGAFDPELMVLTLVEGPGIGLESTWRLLTALHKTILATCDPIPEWLSGHTVDGAPSQHPHVALMPLAFVGREHADGRLMGIGLAMPNGIPPRECGQALRGLLYTHSGDSNPVELKAGSLGSWTLLRETRPSPPITLQGRTWTAPSHTWATVTPIVLDRHPKAERAKDREQWSLEVAEIIAESCERQELPRPVDIDVDKTSWHRGAPRAVAGKGAGYPLMPVKNGQTKRQQVHAWLRFGQEVEGPLLLGAGRYRGYGVCRPWKGG